MTLEIAKKLSANDVGETGGHQAGVLVPREKTVLDFFPQLDATVKNPRMVITVRELPVGNRWTFNYIYYNTKLLGTGTRNEYRLTGMTAFLRSLNVKVGDELRFSRDEDLNYTVRLVRAGQPTLTGNDDQHADSAVDDVLTLSAGWRVIKR
jgi:Restriction endonuclease EcoRII, N-terminal